MRRTRERNVGADTILIDEHTLIDLTGGGRNSARKIAAEAGAVVRIGRRTFFHLPTIKRYLDGLRGNA